MQKRFRKLRRFFKFVETNCMILINISRTITQTSNWILGVSSTNTGIQIEVVNQTGKPVRITAIGSKFYGFWNSRTYAAIGNSMLNIQNGKSMKGPYYFTSDILASKNPTSKVRFFVEINSQNGSQRYYSEQFTLRQLGLK